MRHRSVTVLSLPLLTVLALVGAVPSAAWAAPTEVGVGLYAPDGQRADAPVELSLDVKGDAALTGVGMTVTVPAGTSLAPAEGLSCSDAHCVLTSSERLVSVTLALRVPAAGSYTVAVALDQSDGYPDDDRASVTVEVLPPLPSARFALTPLPSVVGYEDELRVGGVLRLGDGSVPRDYTRVELAERRQGETEFRPTGGSTGVEQGRFSFGVPTDGPHDYAWIYPGDGVTARTVSPVISIRPVLHPTSTLDPVRVPPGGSSSLIATVRGPAAGRTMGFQKWNGSAWVTFASRGLSGPGSVRVPLTRLAAGTLRLRTALSGSGAAPSAPAVLPVSMSGRGSARDYVFVQEKSPGVPVRWNPCAPVTWKVNPAQAPRGGTADLAEALRRLTQATGLPFRYAGTTTVIPRSPADTRSGALLTVAWARPSQTPMLPGRGELGVGGATAQGRSQYSYADWRFVSGAVVLAAGERLSPGFGRGATEGALLMHELAHAVGLDHSGPPQIMAPSMDDNADAAMWGAGDLSGLRRVGRAAGCIR